MGGMGCCGPINKKWVHLLCCCPLSFLSVPCRVCCSFHPVSYCFIYLCLSKSFHSHSWSYISICLGSSYSVLSPSHSLCPCSLISVYKSQPRYPHYSLMFSILHRNSLSPLSSQLPRGKKTKPPLVLLSFLLTFLLTALHPLNVNTQYVWSSNIPLFPLQEILFLSFKNKNCD